MNGIFYVDDSIILSNLMHLKAINLIMKLKMNIH